MNKEDRNRIFLERTDTWTARRNATAKKVAALLAESAATMPQVEEIMERAKRHLVAVVKDATANTVMDTASAACERYSEMMHTPLAKQGMCVKESVLRKYEIPSEIKIDHGESVAE